MVGGKNLAEFSAISLAVEKNGVWQYLTTDFGTKGSRLGCQRWSAVADPKRDADSRANAANPVSECRVAPGSRRLPGRAARMLGAVDPVRSAVPILVVSPVGVEPVITGSADSKVEKPCTCRANDGAVSSWVGDLVCEMYLQRPAQYRPGLEHSYRQRQ